MTQRQLQKETEIANYARSCKAMLDKFIARAEAGDFRDYEESWLHRILFIYYKLEEPDVPVDPEIEERKQKRLAARRRQRARSGDEEGRGQMVT